MQPEVSRDGALLVVGIPGSLRKGSFTRMAVSLALEGAKEVGAQTRLLDLRDFELGMCEGKQKEDKLTEDVYRLRRELQQAQGIILGTPEYHGSYSGLLKNAIDLMGFEQFEGKMVGLVGVSGGMMGAYIALSHLQAVGRALRAWVVPQQAAIPQAWKAFDTEGNLADEKLAERVKEVGRQVARFAYLHTSERALEFLREWENAPVNPGGAAIVSIVPEEA